MTHWQYILKTLRPHRKRIAWAVVAMLGIMVIDLGSPLVVALLVDHVVGEQRYEWLAPLMLFFLLLPFGGAICKFASSYFVTLLGQRVIFDIRLSLYRKVHKLHCRYMQKTTTGKLMERLRGDVQQVQMLLTGEAPQLLVQLITGAFMLAVMFSMSKVLTLIVVSGMGMYYLNYRYYIPRIKKIQRRYRRKLERLSGQAQERLSGAIVVKSFGRERQEARDFLKKNYKAERVFRRFRLLQRSYGAISNTITYGTYSFVMIGGTILAVQGHVTYGTVTAVVAFAFRLLMPAAMLADLSSQVQQAKVSLDRIFELMYAEPDMVNLPGQKLETVTGEVQFRDVCFEYEPDKPVLKRFDLHVKPGQTVALVGQTGCGKSTIINLIYRYFDVNSGEVLIDGRDIRSLDTRWYRRHLAMVPQEPIILDTTITENIAYGRPDSTPEQILQAARLAELSDLIDRLEHGLDTRIGDQGVTLSVGEKQRLCIARAILSDPAILILDEATSSLDTQAEALIQMAMMRVMARRTSFVVAHRLSTIVNADLIVVLDNGTILEMGNHAQLMKKPDSRYRHLYLTQTASKSKVQVVG